MLKKSVLALVPIFLLGMTNVGAAQVFSYFDCEVSSASAFEDAVTRVHEELSGGLRPTVFLDQSIWNGASETTHVLLLEYANYQDFETVERRIADTPSAALLIESIWEVAECDTEGLAIERGFWGDPEAEWNFYAVIPIVTTDPGLYAEAFGELTDSQSESTSLEGIGLYESRAGGEGANYFVVLGASGMAALNENLDTLQQSDDFADFLEEVASIRTVGPAIQRRRMRTWEP